MLFMKMKL